MEVVITHETGALDSVPVRATDHPLHFELRRHALLAPLGPGDVVAVDESMHMVEVVSLKPQWIHEVSLHLPSDYLTAPMTPEHRAVRVSNRLVDQWSRHTMVTLLTTFDMVMGSPSSRWFNDNVASSRFVLGSSILRNPDLRARS